MPQDRGDLHDEIASLFAADIAAQRGRPDYPPAPTGTTEPAGRDVTLRAGTRGRGEVLRVLDGDTLEVMLDLGGGVRTQTRVRLARVDSPETRGGTAESRAAAAKATDFMRGACEGRTVDITVVGMDAFGRAIAEVSVEGRNLSDAQLAGGLAVPYARSHGGHR